MRNILVTIFRLLCIFIIICCIAGFICNLIDLNNNNDVTKILIKTINYVLIIGGTWFSAKSIDYNK